jgi:hypothetical protein
VDDLLSYLALTGDNYPPEQAQQALDAALAEIDHLCVTDPWAPDLQEAALRRATSILAARGAPLGALDSGQFGMSPLLRYDPEVGKLLAHYWKGAFS